MDILKSFQPGLVTFPRVYSAQNTKPPKIVFKPPVAANSPKTPTESTTTKPPKRVTQRVITKEDLLNDFSIMFYDHSKPSFDTSLDTENYAFERRKSLKKGKDLTGENFFLIKAQN